VKQIVHFIVAVGALCGLATNAWCTQTFFILQKDARFIQNGPTTTTGDGFTFLGRASPNDGIGPISFERGTFTFPAPSPLNARATGACWRRASVFVWQDRSADLQTNYPDGIYTFHMTDSTNATNTQTQAVDSRIVAAPATVPLRRRHHSTRCRAWTQPKRSR